jgi:hypothetical protein
VQRPDGKFSTIPLSSFPIAQAKGYTLAAPKFAPSRPQVPKELQNSPTTLAEYPGKILDRVGENFKALGDTPKRMGASSRAEYLKLHPEGTQTLADKFSPRSLMDALSAMSGSILSEAGGAVKGLVGVTAPGIAYRMANKEKPENIAGDAAMFFMPGGEEGARSTYKPGDLTKPGPLWGAKTRAIESYKAIDKVAHDIPIDHTPAMDLANKAMELGRRGYQIPKPITDFAKWVETHSKGSAAPMGGSSFMDTAGSMQPVTYDVARDFKTAIREAVPWDEYGGKNGKMFAIAKQMERSLDNSIVESLKPHWLDVPYRRANAQYAKAMKALDKSWGLGYIGGKVAGYGAGSVVGHPLLLGYGGGKAGQSLAGSMVRSITEQGGGNASTK